jgi:hypothetical protein
VAEILDTSPPEFKTSAKLFLNRCSTVFSRSEIQPTDLLYGQADPITPAIHHMAKFLVRKYGCRQGVI